jgi:hypothetical protein
LFVQDPQTCKCSCKNTDSRCKARQLELNERTCRLVPRGRASESERGITDMGRERGERERESERERDRESTPVRGQLLARLLAACLVTAAFCVPKALRALVWSGEPAPRLCWLPEWVGWCVLVWWCGLKLCVVSCGPAARGGCWC